MAVLSVTIPDAAVLRVRNAVAVAKGIAPPASLAQVQDACRDWLRELCFMAEHQVRQTAVNPDSEAAISVDFPKP
jgi:hypothetical protein